MIKELAALNLNLLVTLHVLLTEKNVTKAAAKLNLSQSTVSGSLKQLRNIFDDDLLSKGYGNRMYLTVKAKNLIQPVSEAMKYVGNIFVAEKPFLPEVAETVFNIGMNDYIEFLMVPRLIKLVTEKAPKVKLNIVHLNNLRTYKKFKEKNLDIALGIFSLNNKYLFSEDIFTDENIIFCDKNCNALKSRKITLDIFDKYKTIEVLFRKKEFYKNLTPEFCKTLKKSVVVTVPSMPISFKLIENSDFISIGSKKAISKLQDKYIIRKLPEKLLIGKNRYIIRQFWKSIDDCNPAQKWMRNLIKEVASTI